MAGRNTILLSDGGGTTTNPTGKMPSQNYTQKTAQMLMDYSNKVNPPSTLIPKGQAKAPQSSYVPSSSGNTGGGSSAGYEYSAGSDSGILGELMRLMREQEAASKNYYNSLYNQRMNQITSEGNKNRDLINEYYKRGERYLNNLYGRTDSGNNWTNRARNNQNWLSQLAANRENVANLKDSAAAQRDMGLANAASTLAQGWYNYVLPAAIDEEKRNYNYRNYISSL